MKNEDGELTIKDLMALLVSALHEKAMANFDVESLIENSPDYFTDGDGIEFVGGGSWDGKRIAPTCAGIVYDVPIKRPPCVEMGKAEYSAILPMYVYHYRRVRRQDGHYVMEYDGIAKR